MRRETYGYTQTAAAVPNWVLLALTLGGVAAVAVATAIALRDVSP